MDRAKIPATLADDETLVRVIAERYGEHRWMFIPNTLHLEKLYVTGDVAEQLSRRSGCRVGRQAEVLQFRSGQLDLTF